MKNHFLTIARARIKPDAETETLLARLRCYPELTLVHLFSHEPVLLLFIEITHIHDFSAVDQRLINEAGIAECTYRHLYPTVQTFEVPMYQPRTWLL